MNWFCFRLLIGAALMEMSGAVSTPSFAAPLPTVEKTDVFVSGREGYHTYRIPAILRTREGTLLAFCEGRKNSGSDTGDIDLLVKRSSDGGKTWSAATVIWDDGANTCGNPCPVLDQSTGDIWLLMTHNLGIDKEDALVGHTAQAGRTVWLANSADDGATWTKPVEITSTTKDSSWGWYATGPGVGIQINQGAHAGRLVIPCDHTVRDAEKKTIQASHVIYSDDHGRTWRLGGSAQPKVNESQVVELYDGEGTLLLDMRSYAGRGCRAQSLSSDGGDTWTAPRDVPALIEPNCQGSILRADAVTKSGVGTIIFSNPADEKKRIRLTVRASDDDARTWPRALELHAGPAAYSCLVALENGQAGCLYENGEKRPYERLTFARFTVSQIPVVSTAAP